MLFPALENNHYYLVIDSKQKGIGLLAPKVI